MARLLERRRLSNGLWLEFWDESRKVAGDRWYVGIAAVVPVLLPDGQCSGVPTEALEMMRERVGPNVCFHRRFERNFIPEGEVEEVRDDLKRKFMKDSLPYLSHPDFARRFLIKASREVLQKASWGSDYLKKALIDLAHPYDHKGDRPSGGVGFFPKSE
jgi:hypothetical protein